MNLVFSFLVSLTLIVASQFERPLSFQHQGIFVSPPEHIEYFAFGFHEVIADSLWIRAIQDFDFCEQQLAKNLCRGQGWLFKMLDAITNLSPKNKQVYFSGGLALTVIISDYEGASKIFDKGVALYPKDWRLLYAAAYHALFEEKNKTKAANLAIQAAQNGAPSWLYSMAAGLYSEDGKKQLGEKLYESLEQSGFDESVLKRMREKLDQAR